MMSRDRMRPRILVTRSLHQTSALAAHLRALGAEPILVPTITLAAPSTHAPLDTALADLDAFDWIVFTSANAVEAFVSRVPLGKRSIPKSGTKSGTKIAAIGPATAQALTDVGLRPDLIPPQAIAESLAQTLLGHITSGETRVLLVRAETARDHLPKVLQAAGAQLTIAPAYRTIVPESSIPLLQELFRTPETWPDAITFTSSSTATNLIALLDAAGLALPVDTSEHRPILRASIGPITSQTLRELGYPAHLQAAEATVPSLVRTVAEALNLSLSDV